jgi:hypothetical protein
VKVDVHGKKYFNFCLSKQKIYRRNLTQYIKKKADIFAFPQNALPSLNGSNKFNLFFSKKKKEGKKMEYCRLSLYRSSSNFLMICLF